jgi:hypothetical protein
MVREAGFVLDEVHPYYVEGDPKCVGFVTRGVARAEA